MTEMKYVASFHIYGRNRNIVSDSALLIFNVTVPRISVAVRDSRNPKFCPVCCYCTPRIHLVDVELADVAANRPRFWELPEDRNSVPSPSPTRHYAEVCFSLFLIFFFAAAVLPTDLMV